MLALLPHGNQRRAAVELVHDVKDVLFDVRWRGPRCKQSANPKMRHSTFAFGDERISRLLDTVVEECVGAVRAGDEAGPDGFPERRVHCFLEPPVNQGERSYLCRI